ncbi:hypothetical protein JK359_01020 [Streptomyces actinomycinicus]|uniref:Secreted protein n=1 Tax=Streptomyces actinomycinicus TaxID=1695166 RepID=A0A937ECX2_9ACTN|nr:hypothetical protein [Streptomyces actinomycinicus]MBL1080568.1 hypothetical protein [Streptomyces actinomycinicus]
MLTSQKFATVTALVGSLAAVCVGAGHAYADTEPGDCKPTAQGGTVCIHKKETRTDKDGTHLIRQEQDCSTSDRPRVVFPEDGLTEGSSASVGPVVDCSNRAELPKGFKKPHIEI